ncbi:MAG: histidine phosphotransferase family protein [Pseudomonadota bacterium]
MSTARDLNALLGSRICHDLISPLGAIGNGVELLSMSGIGAAPELALISESVEAANARIRFYRIAFGAASQAATLSPAEVKDILTDMLRGSRLQINWEPGGAMPRPRVKLAFLLLQCLESAMPYGGQIRVAQKIAGWEITGEAERMKIDTRLWELLVNDDAETEMIPADVHFALVSRAAEAARAHLDTEVREDRVRIAF